ncbi:hypothetical protein BDV96DRAFT_688292 [Lophiotrema nucula]|uniref:Uncharacterized protein n=1 Tax=Lophiotrema nucula TaxID=690887 RepID=A0A6A5Z6K3_9PLEO|nr:hypothetical protein BDV96DRAFT_688292 [Lophiotrema nucula]
MATMRRIADVSAPTGDIDLSVIVMEEGEFNPDQASLPLSWRWIPAVLKELSLRAQIHVCGHALSSSDTVLWQALISRAGELVELILEEYSTSPALQHPILFVCHGLGGLVMKRIFVDLSEQQFKPAHRQLFHCIRGVAFFGVPHPTYEHRDRWAKLRKYLQNVPSMSKKMLERSEEETAVVAQVSMKLEELGSDIHTVSVYETKPTRIKNGRWFHMEKTILVDRDFCETRLENEELVPNSSDHTHVHVVQRNSPLFQAVLRLFRTATTDFMVPVNVTELSPNIFQVQVNAWASTQSEVSLEANRQSPNPPITQPSSNSQKWEMVPRNSGSSSMFPMPLELDSDKSLLALQSRNPDFFGRREVLERLDEHLLPSKTKGLRTFALCGMGGIGKSQIATEFAISRKGHFDAVFWIQADDLGKLGTSFSRIAEQLGLKGADDRIISLNYALEWLSCPRKRITRDELAVPVEYEEAKWLLIYDNADDIRILRDYWPVGANGSVLITSRDPLAKSELYPAVGLDLEAFSTDDAARLLRRLTREESGLDSQQSSQALAKSMRGYPLHVVQVAALIRRLQLPLKDFWEMHREHMDLEKFADNIAPPEQYKHTIFTVWSFDKLSSTAGAILDFLSLLDPDFIDEHLLQVAYSTPGMSDFPVSKIAYINARTELIKLSLIRITRPGDGRCLLSIHRLVQDAARGRLNEERKIGMFDFALRVLRKAWPEEMLEFSHDIQDWVSSDRVVPHVRALQTAYENGPKVCPDVDSKRLFASLLQMNGWYMIERGNLPASREILKTGLAFCRANADIMPDILADMLSSHTFMADDPECNYDEMLEIFRQHLDLRLVLEDKSENKDDLMMAYGEMGQALFLNGRYEEALVELKKSMAEARSLESVREERFWPTFTSLRLGITYQVLGRPEEAVAAVNEALDFREKKFGPKDKESCRRGYLIELLGDLHAQHGRTAESLDAYEQALDNFRVTKGQLHRNIGQICIKIAWHKARAGSTLEAKNLLNEALRILGSRPPFPALAAHTKLLIAKADDAAGTNEDAAKEKSEAKKLFGLVRKIGPEEVVSVDNVEPWLWKEKYYW